MILLVVTSNEFGRVQVEKVLHDTLCIRGRALPVVSTKDSFIFSAESTSAPL